LLAPASSRMRDNAGASPEIPESWMGTGQAENLIIEDAKGIRIIRLNRPDALNALTPEMFDELGTALQAVQTGAGIRVVLIAGEGRAFAAGAGIARMKELSPEECEAFLSRGQGVLDQIGSVAIPVIAVVNGICVGGGHALALACDFRLWLGTPQRLAQPEAKIGLPGGLGNVYRLLKIVGPGKAAELLMTGNAITAAAAERVGIVERVVPAASL